MLGESFPRLPSSDIQVCHARWAAQSEASQFAWEGRVIDQSRQCFVYEGRIVQRLLGAIIFQKFGFLVRPYKSTNENNYHDPTP
jgi:hypothetical protein